MTALAFLAGLILGGVAVALLGFASRNLHRSVAFMNAAELATRGGSYHVAAALRTWSRNPGGGREHMPSIECNRSAP